MRKPKSVYIIAEAGVNHNGSLDLARRLIDVAAEAGADAVKFQTFKTEKLVSKLAPKAGYQRQTTGDEGSQYDMIRQLELDAIAHQQLIAHCDKAGIQFLSTPFDLQSVDLLAQTLDLPFLKISSGEITNAPLLLKIAQTSKPVLLSTGMSTLGEIEQALGVLAFGYLQPSVTPSLEAFKEAYCSMVGQQVLVDRVRLLHCTTEYPAPFEEVNLRAIDTLKAAFGLPVGFSDHTRGITIPIAAVSRGARIVEKHFTLDRNLPGPDHQASLEPKELQEMVQSIRQVEKALGSPFKIPGYSESKNIPVARKSIVAQQSILIGEKFTTDNITIKRSGGGISPMYFWQVLGRTAQRKFNMDEIIEI